MTWFKVDDTLHSHKKAMRAGTEAMGLWVLAGSWAADQLTDGWVPEYAVSRWAPNAPALAEKLVAAGLWTADEYDGDRGWWFHQWDERQPTRSDVLSRRKADADRRAKWRQARGKAGARDGSQREAQREPQPVSQRESQWASQQESQGESESVSHPAARAVSHEVSRRDTDRVSQPESRGESVLPDPTRPDPGSSYEEPKSEGPRKRGHRLPENFAITDDMTHWATQHTPDVDPQRETDKFLDHFHAKTGQAATKLDWTATWRNWLRREQETLEARRPTRLRAVPKRPAATIPDADIDVEAILGPDYWTPVNDEPLDVSELPHEQRRAWLRDAQHRHHTERIAEARQVLARRQHRGQHRGSA